jgi:hypothetical protein
MKNYWGGIRCYHDRMSEVWSNSNTDKAPVCVVRWVPPPALIVRTCTLRSLSCSCLLCMCFCWEKPCAAVLGLEISSSYYRHMPTSAHQFRSTNYHFLIKLYILSLSKPFQVYHRDLQYVSYDDVPWWQGVFSLPETCLISLLSSR